MRVKVIAEIDFNISVFPDDVINYEDEISLIIVRNLKYVILPDFYGWYYKEVLSFFQKNEVNVEDLFIK